MLLFFLYIRYNVGRGGENMEKNNLIETVENEYSQHKSYLVEKSTFQITIKTYFEHLQSCFRLQHTLINEKKKQDLNYKKHEEELQELRYLWSRQLKYPQYIIHRHKEDLQLIIKLHPIDIKINENRISLGLEKEETLQRLQTELTQLQQEYEYALMEKDKAKTYTEKDIENITGPQPF